jgi:hypothetical protein
LSFGTFELFGALSGLAFVVVSALSGFIDSQQRRVDSWAATLAWVTDNRVVFANGDDLR